MENSTNKSLGTRIYNILEDRILSGEYEIGESLIEMKLAKEFDVSRTPVREAIHQLERKGLVKIVTNKGAEVVGITNSDLAQIYTIRMKLEGLAARWATENISDDDLIRLRESVELLEFYSMKNNNLALSKTDSSFHEIIYESCDSKILKNILGDFHNYINRATKNPLENPKRINDIITEHKEILNAIESGNADLAEKLAVHHVEVAAKNLSDK